MPQPITHGLKAGRLTATCALPAQAARLGALRGPDCPECSDRSFHGGVVEAVNLVTKRGPGTDLGTGRADAGTGS